MHRSRSPLSRTARARLLAFRRELVEALPGFVEDVILFGSRARGEARVDSDYDVAVVMSGGLANDRDVHRRISDIAWNHHADGCIIQAVPLNAEMLHPARTELAMRIAGEGMPIR